MPDFYTVVTDTGLQALGLAFTQGESFYLTQAVVGDGNGVPVIPNKGMATLVNEVWRGNVAGIKVDPDDPNTLIFEFAIPADTGGFTIREVGLLDENAKLFCVGNFPVTEKPVAADGSVRDLVVRLPLHFENADAVNLVINPAIVLATKQDLLDHNADPQAHRLATTLETGFVRLATDEEHIAHQRKNVAATPWGVWKLIEALKSDAVDLASSLRLATSQAVKSVQDALTTHKNAIDPHNILSQVPEVTKSSSVTSSSTETVATSKAVKTVNDSLVEKVDKTAWKILVPDRAWQRPDGIIEQIGRVSFPTSGDSSISVLFPIPFPNEVLHADWNIWDAGLSQVIGTNLANVTKEGMTLVADKNSYQTITLDAHYYVRGR